MNKEGSFKPIIFVMLASLVIAFCWEKTSWIKNSVHAVLDPSAGALLNWNLIFGMILIVFLITIITTLVQKYATDQKTLREMKKEQKILQAEMKKYKEHPEKLMELQKKQFAFVPKTMKLSMRAVMFTGIPFVLFFRWFSDYFAALGEYKLWFGMSWFLFYILFSVVFSSIFRKAFKVV